MIGIFVGNNRAQEGELPELRYAEEDTIQAAKAWLETHPNGTMWLLLPDTTIRPDMPDDYDIRYGLATESGLENTFIEVADFIDSTLSIQEGSSASVYLQFSGHGETGGRLHLADSVLLPSQFKEIIGRPEIDLIYLMLDGCHLADLMKGDEMPDIWSGVDILTDRDLSKIGLIGSSDAVPERNILKGGQLSHLATIALRGLADADHNDDVTFLEIGHFIDSQVGTGGPGLHIRIETPDPDPLAPLVQTDELDLGWISLDDKLAHGVLKVSQPGEDRPIALFRPSGKAGQRLYLSKGDYTIEFVIDATKQTPSSYQIHTFHAEISDGNPYSLSLNNSHTLTLSREDPAKGGEGTQTGLTFTPLTEAEAHRLRTIFKDYRQPTRRRPLYRPTAQLSLVIDQPHSGLDLNGLSQRAPGGSAHFGWAAKTIGHGRALFSVGPTIGMGSHRHPELYPASGPAVEGVTTLEPRMGLLLQGAHYLRSRRLAVGLTTVWAPTFFFSNGKAISTPGMAQSHEALWNAWATGITLGGRWHAFRGWQLGPEMRLEVIHFNPSPRLDGDQGLSQAYRLGIGLTLAQEPWQ